jgi:hypothetical protein
LKATPRGGFQDSVWMSRICLRAAASGSVNMSSRSKRPGRRSAGSIASGRLVAP